MKTIYVFSGLGADERVFYKIDFSSYNVVFIKWITPAKSQSIEDYAYHLSKQIKTPHPILLGLSFGGMMAIEVGKHILVDKTILISSAKTKSELPSYYILAGVLRLHKLIPTKFLVKANMFTNWFFSNRTLEDKKMFSAILHDTDTSFLKWAIAQIVTWKNSTVPKNLLHIHGTADRILPYNKVNANIKVIGGGHLMVIGKAQEISIHLKNILN